MRVRRISEKKRVGHKLNFFSMLKTVKTILLAGSAYLIRVALAAGEPLASATIDVSATVNTPPPPPPAATNVPVWSHPATICLAIAGIIGIALIQRKRAALEHEEA